MTPNHCFKVRGFILAAVFSACLGFATSASAQQRSYLVDLNSNTATDIGNLGGDYSYVEAINDAGQVAGYFYTAERVYHAFITGPNGVGMRDLGTLGAPADSVARGINDAGQVVGESGSHAFITGPDGMGMRDLGTLSQFHDYSLAFGINDAGQVVGWSHAAGDGFHAFITGPNGMGMRNLGTLGGDHSEAYDINDAGQVVGYSEGGGFHAFITGPNGMGMRDLGTLGGDYSEARGINDAGQVAGYSNTAGGAHHAFITGPDGAGMMDLNSLVDLPEGVILFYAADINNSGQVIAIGTIPEPEIHALFLAGLALVGFISRRKKQKSRFSIN